MAKTEPCPDCGEPIEGVPCTTPPRDSNFKGGMFKTGTATYYSCGECGCEWERRRTRTRLLNNERVEALP